MEDKLQVIVKESGLTTTRANYILNKFQEYFAIADEWEKKAKTIVVDHELQTAEMKMARVGRLFLKEKRISVEKARKELKEQSLREGKAIDGIANVLKAIIVPIEEYLNQQEHFVEIKEKEEEDKRRKEIERRMEEERIAEEKAAEEARLAEQNRIRLENEKLREKAVLREKTMEAERKAAEAIATEERLKQQKKLQSQKAQAEKERLIAEEKARKVQAENEKKLAEERKEREVLAEKLRSQIKCPFCHITFTPGEE